MLSIVVDALHYGSVADVLVVPVGISYDRIIEGNYNSEQLASICEFEGGTAPRQNRAVMSRSLSGQAQEERELVGDSLWSVQDAQEELWLCPSGLQPALLPKGELFRNERVCSVC